jgi:hypothetical protein
VEGPWAASGVNQSPPLKKIPLVQVDLINGRGEDLERVLSEGQRVRDVQPSFHILLSVLKSIHNMHIAGGYQGALNDANEVFRAGLHIALVNLKPGIMPSFERNSWQERRLVG